MGGSCRVWLCAHHKCGRSGALRRQHAHRRRCHAGECRLPADPPALSGRRIKRARSMSQLPQGGSCAHLPERTGRRVSKPAQARTACGRAPRGIDVRFGADRDAAPAGKWREQPAHQDVLRLHAFVEYLQRHAGVEEHEVALGARTSGPCAQGGCDAVTAGEDAPPRVGRKVLSARLACPRAPPGCSALSCMRPQCDGDLRTRDRIPQAHARHAVQLGEGAQHDHAAVAID